MRSPLKVDFTLIARQTPENTAILDYFCFPWVDEGPGEMTVGQDINGVVAFHRFTDLAFLKDVAANARDKANSTGRT